MNFISYSDFYILVICTSITYFYILALKQRLDLLQFWLPIYPLRYPVFPGGQLNDNLDSVYAD